MAISNNGRRSVGILSAIHAGGAMMAISQLFFFFCINSAGGEEGSSLPDGMEGGSAGGILAGQADCGRTRLYSRFIVSEKAPLFSHTKRGRHTYEQDYAMPVIRDERTRSCARPRFPSQPESGAGQEQPRSMCGPSSSLDTERRPRVADLINALLVLLGSELERGYGICGEEAVCADYGVSGPESQLRAQLPSID